MAEQKVEVTKTTAPTIGIKVTDLKGGGSIKTISGPGGTTQEFSGLTAQQIQSIKAAQAKKLAEEKARKSAEEKRLRELQQRKAAEVERLRELRLREKLKRINANTRTRRLRDSSTGQIIRETVIGRGSKAKGPRIFIRENLSTGERNVMLFEKKKGKTKLTGGYIQNGQGLPEQTIMGGEVQPLEQPKGRIAKLIKKIEDLQKIKSEKSFRTKQREIKNELALLGLTSASSVIAAARGFKDLPKTVKELVKNPKQIKQIPSSIKQGGERLGYLLRVSPTEAIAKIGTEYLVLKGSGKALKVTGKLGKETATLTKVFKGVKKTPLGVKVIPTVKGVGDIEIIPPRGSKLPVNIKKVLKVAQTEKQLKKVPTLPKTTRDQKRILKILRRRKDIVTGSFAQQTLLKKRFARKFKDLDIVTKDPEKLIAELRKEFGKRISFKKRKNAVEARLNGKAIADIVPFKKGEGGFVKKFGAVEVGGVRVADPRARLGGKLTALKQGTIKKKKTAQDIEKLTGKRVEADIPAVTGAFKKTKKELRESIGKKGPVTTSQIDFFKGVKTPKIDISADIKKGKVDIKSIRAKIKNKNPQLKLKRFLYASPFRKGGKAQVRVSRLGLSEREANLMDYLLGEDIAFRSNKPEILVFKKEKIAPKGKITTKSKFAETKGFEVPEFSGELEVILGKGYAVRKGKTLSRVNIDGRIVPVREVKKVKITKESKNLFSSIQKERREINKILSKKKLRKSDIKKLKSKAQSLNKKDAKLSKRLQKETGIRYDVSSRLQKGRKVVPIKRIAASLSLEALRKLRASGGMMPSKVSKRTTIIKRKPIIPSKTKGVTKRSSRGISPPGKSKSIPSKQLSPPTKPPSKPPKKILLPVKRPSKKIKKKVKSKVFPGYNVYARPLKKSKRAKKPSLIKVNKAPLTRSRAQDLRNYITDTSLARTAELRGTTAKPSKAKIRVPVGYAARTRAKFRSYRIVKGKRKPLAKGRVIEKSGRLLDTRQERKRISLKKRIAEINRPIRKKAKTKKSKIKKGKRR